MRRSRVGLTPISFAVITILGAVSPPPSAAEVALSAVLSIDVERTPTSVAVADLNGDGYIDIASGSQSGGDVTVLLGRGDGTFLRSELSLSGGVVGAITIADINSDEHPDLLIASLGNIFIPFFGVGDGTFARGPSTDPVCCGPVAITAGDLNGDTLPDVAIANSASSSVSVLLGNGDGTFQALRFFGTGIGPSSVAIGNMNADAFPDLVVANSYDGTVSVLLGYGDGTFATKADFGTGPGPRSVRIADLNEDLKLDVVVADAGYPYASISVLLGVGDGTLRPRSVISAGSEPYAVAVGDPNRDGHADLIVGNAQSNTLSVFLGNGAGAFGARKDYGTGIQSSPRALEIGDINQDTFEDYVVGCDGPRARLSILLGKGDGGLVVADEVSAGQYPFSLRPGDFNGDGFEDLAVVNNGGASISVFLGDGSGQLGERRVLGWVYATVVIGLACRANLWVRNRSFVAR